MSAFVSSSLKLAIGALADVLWDCGTGEETQIDHRDRGPKMIRM